MMITSKSGTAPSQPAPECCMCGDHGLSSELFKCKVCRFRSQHRYCSNLYPKAESYRVCNWCLSQTQKDDAAERAQTSSDSPSSSNRNSSEDDRLRAKKKNGGHGSLKGPRGNLLLQISSPIKKQRSPEPSPSSAARKRIVTGRVEDRLRRTKSEEISNGGITKQVFRNKVRRYKLLDEVSSQ